MFSVSSLLYILSLSISLCAVCVSSFSGARMSKHFNSNSLIEEENYPHKQKSSFFHINVYLLLIWLSLIYFFKSNNKEKKKLSASETHFLSLLFIFSLSLSLFNFLSRPLTWKTNKNFFYFPVNWHSLALYYACGWFYKRYDPITNKQRNPPKNFRRKNCIIWRTYPHHHSHSYHLFHIF